MTASTRPQIVWEDPPPARSDRYGEALATLKANPGKWARLRGVSKFFAYSLRKGNIKGINADEYDAITRTEADGTITTWARYRPRT